MRGWRGWDGMKFEINRMTKEATMKLSEIMTRDVHIIAPDTPLADAAERMRALDVGTLPVLDGDEVLGVLTDRDIVVRSTARGDDPRQKRVAEVMTPEVVWLYED